MRDTEAATPAIELPSSGRWYVLDYIKAIAIIAVIFTHSGFAFWSPHYSRIDKLLCSGWVTFHVPCFFVVSGFLSAGRGSVDGQTLGLRLVRLLGPYLVACAIVQICGLSTARQPGEILFQVVTGSTLGIYYFVFLIVLFSLLTWPMSRASDLVLRIVLVGLVVYVVLVPFVPHLALTSRIFWNTRNPLYSYPYFLAGWLARAHWGSVWELYDRHRKALVTAAVVVIVAYVFAPAIGLNDARNYFTAVYTLGVILVIGGAFESSIPGSTVSFLSGSTYSIYLFHHIFQLFYKPLVAAWPAPIRIFTTVLVGLLGGLAVTYVGRHLLGRYAKYVVG